jgi:glutathione S-transferase
VALDPVAAAYVEAVHAWPAFREWQATALAEPWIIPEDEVE